MTVLIVTIQGAACFPSNISAYDADFPQELIDVYGITDVGRRILASITNPGIPVSEDCLSLNVWTKPQTGEKRKPVMIYIHGGSFVSGNIALLLGRVNSVLTLHR